MLLSNAGGGERGSDTAGGAVAIARYARGEAVDCGQRRKDAAFVEVVRPIGAIPGTVNVS